MKSWKYCVGRERGLAAWNRTGWRVLLGFLSKTEMTETARRSAIYIHMLEGVLERLLTAGLGRYLTGLDKKNFSVGLWRGDIVLENADIKPEALGLLQLPLVLVMGKIQQLVIKVPWTRLGSASVEIQVSGVYVLLRDLDQANWTYNEADAVSALKDRLESFEAARAAQQAERQLSPEEALKGKSFTERLSAKVIDNLLVTINDVHICFELTSSHRPAPCGLILKSLQCCTTNPDWTMAFLDRQSTPQPSKTTCKLLQLKGFCVYFQAFTSQSPYTDLDSAAICDYLHRQIANQDSLHYLLQPSKHHSVDIEARVVHNADFADFSRPQYSVHVALQRLEIAYQQGQLQSTVEVLGFFTAYKHFLGQQ